MIHDKIYFYIIIHEPSNSIVRDEIQSFVNNRVRISVVDYVMTYIGNKATLKNNKSMPTLQTQERLQGLKRKLSCLNFK